MTSRNWINQIRWHDVKNTESEAVPAFGVMLVEGRSTSDAGMVLTIGKPTSALESDPQPGRVMINGPTQIGAGLRGSGTQQWPALVQVSGSLAIGDEIGPTNNSWAMSSSGTGFVVMALGNVLGVSTAYVSPIFSAGGAAATTGWGASLSDTGETSLLDGTSFDGSNETASASGVVGTRSDGDFGLTVSKAGSYLVCASATITSQDASNGDRIGFTINFSTGGLVSGGRGIRHMVSPLVTTSPNTFYDSRENISVSGIATTASDTTVGIGLRAASLDASMGSPTVDWSYASLEVVYLG